MTTECEKEATVGDSVGIDDMTIDARQRVKSQSYQVH